MSHKPMQPAAFAFNPLAGASCQEVQSLLQQVVIHDVSQEEAAELEDQIEALAHAVVELRDAGHLELNIGAVASLATLDGFASLAADSRLSSLARARCAAIHNRMTASLVRGVHLHLFS